MATAFRGGIDHYSGSRGRAYHATVHAGDDATHAAIAASRARKLQPLISPEDRVLEYGAGMLFNLRALRCAERVAFDVSDAGEAAAHRMGVRFTTDPAAVGEGFDAVLCHHVLEHVTDPHRLIQDMAERIRTGGKLLLFVPMETGGAYNPNDPHRHLYTWTPATLGNLVATAGLTVESAVVGAFGYERRLAPIDAVSRGTYRAALALAQALRPAREVRLVARKH